MAAIVQAQLRLSAQLFRFGVQFADPGLPESSIEGGLKAVGAFACRCTLHLLKRGVGEKVSYGFGTILEQAAAGIAGIALHEASTLAVECSRSEGFQDQEIEGALEKIRFGIAHE
jgi:hypothetical protein